jgi:homoserine O-acetyltransferase/O-succinyltransferase
MSDYKEYVIPGFTTQSGVSLDARIAYQTYGKMTPARDNVVVVPTFYGGRHTETEYLMAAGRVIDPAKYFVVIPNMFCNGLSSSPSNTDPPIGRGAFPDISLYDNVTAQHRLLTEHLGVERIRLVVGFSMGGQQTYQWGALYSDMVDAIVPICASAKTSKHNRLMIDGPTSALRADAAFNEGWYESVPMKGMLAFGRVYAGWLFSQTFFREELYRDIGLHSVEDAVHLTQGYFLQNDANDLLAMARTWQSADISANPVFDGDFDAALAAIDCRAIVMPAETDLYFRVPDNEFEVARMPNAAMRPIPSPWGHAAGFGMNPVDNDFIDAALKEVLNET